MTLLFRHPDTPPGAVRDIDVELDRIKGGAVARFRVIGEVARLVVPPPRQPARADDLWRTTCCELFVAGKGAAYVEYNLSPSGEWAAHHFDGYRCGMRPQPADISINLTSDDKGLTLEATILAEFPDPARVGMTAVIEETDGHIRYWATSFAPGKPDFHTDSVRSLFFDGVSAE